MPPTPPRLLPAVQYTRYLKGKLLNDPTRPHTQEDLDELASLFAEWKAEGQRGEYRYFDFGKDGSYLGYNRAGRPVLWHVHLPPADPEELKQWERDWQRRTRKTSDSALIYAYDPAHGYLLIDIVWEPNGHAAAKNKKYMNQMADVAEAFIFCGKVIV